MAFVELSERWGGCRPTLGGLVVMIRPFRRETKAISSYIKRRVDYEWDCDGGKGGGEGGFSSFLEVEIVDVGGGTRVGTADIREKGKD